MGTYLPRVKVPGFLGRQEQYLVYEGPKQERAERLLRPRGRNLHQTAGRLGAGQAKYIPRDLKDFQDCDFCGLLGVCVRMLIAGV